MIDLRREGAVFVLTMNAGENRFNRQFVGAMDSALDEVERSTGAAALVTTGGSEKFYSNGLDLDWMMGDGKDQVQETLRAVFRMLARILGSPVPSVAAINGHAFAGGAMLAAAHDYRVMREDRGFFCLPEVDLGMPLAPGMAALLNAKIHPHVLRDLLLTHVVEPQLGRGRLTGSLTKAVLPKLAFSITDFSLPLRTSGILGTTNLTICMMLGSAGRSTSWSRSTPSSSPSRRNSENPTPKPARARNRRRFGTI